MHPDDFLNEYALQKLVENPPTIRLYSRQRSDGGFEELRVGGYAAQKATGKMVDGSVEWHASFKIASADGIASGLFIAQRGETKCAERFKTPIPLTNGAVINVCIQLD